MQKSKSYWIKRSIIRFGIDFVLIDNMFRVLGLFLFWTKVPVSKIYAQGKMPFWTQCRHNRKFYPKIGCNYSYNGIYELIFELTSIWVFY